MKTAPDYTVRYGSDGNGLFVVVVHTRDSRQEPLVWFADDPREVSAKLSVRLMITYPEATRIYDYLNARVDRLGDPIDYSAKIGGR